MLVEHLPPSLMLVLAIRGESLTMTRAAWTRFLVMASLNSAIPVVQIAYGDITIGSGLASILSTTTPVFTVLVAHALTDDEKLTPLRGLRVGLSFVGVVVLVWPDRIPGAPDLKSAW